jgi:adenine/guanine phosphoribosyltransferase-like PRPP-binding protein
VANDAWCVTSLPPYRVDWQSADDATASPALPSATHYPVRLKDGCQLCLPLTPLPGGEMAVALLMSNQTSFAVERNIVKRMTEEVRALAPDVVVGIPTLGLTYARPVAEAIGLADFVALGHSRKFWYDDALSESVVSSTSPDQSKRIYLDPALLARVSGRRVVIIDDVLNTGNTMAAAVKLLKTAQASLVGIIVVLTEGWDWRAKLAEIDPTIPLSVRALGHIPLFIRGAAGWTPIPDTEAGAAPIA